MALKEDDIKDLGLDIGDEIVPQAVGSCATVCQNGQADCKQYCQGGAQKCAGCQHECQACENNCQNACQILCEDACLKGCQDTCEKRCQRGCQHDCQSPCEKACQDCQSRCERSEQCSRCEDSCQTSCEENCQYGCQGSCQNTCQSSCQDAAQKNSAPNAPSTINVPSAIKAGETILISWSAASDSDGNLAGYILEKKVDSGSYTQIYKGTERSFSDTIAVGTGVVQYRVRAYDSIGSYSGYKESSAVTITNNSAPEINGLDEDLGGKKAPFKINLSVADKDGDSVDVVAKLNGSIIKTINNIKLNTNYEIEIDAARFNALPLNARNEIEIAATDSKATSYRRYNFARINAAPEIELEKAIFGAQDVPFSFKYKILDAEGDKCGVRVLYGQRVLEAKKEVELGKDQEFKFTKLDFAKIPAGDISIKIEATDANGGISTKLVTFTKTINGCGYIYKKETTAKATQAIISVSRTVDEKSTFKAFVCNNANDAAPTWEEVTGMLEKIYTLKNDKKTAEKWAFGIKVEIVRGKDAGDSYLDAIGFSYR